MESTANSSSNSPHEERTDKHKQRIVAMLLWKSEKDRKTCMQDQVIDLRGEMRQSRRSQSPERGGRCCAESDDFGSDNDRSTGHKNMDRHEGSYRDDRSKGRDGSSWSDKN